MILFKAHDWPHHSA